MIPNARTDTPSSSSTSIPCARATSRRASMVAGDPSWRVLSRRALSPGRPCTVGPARPARDMGVWVDAIPISAMRPLGVSRYPGRLAHPRFSPAPACTSPHSSISLPVSRMPSTP
ncbi:MAG: hypothetical protein OXR82_14780 [Gammaproteobacteria bacterium]|nr:hypothetical protein [Gammaproteobacteria bacterium]MDE0259633.1 hypothetical protein [Gammaproteobacteria bacterium]